MQTEKFDYIFAGFGLSGMTLLYELSKHPSFKSKTVLVIDRDQKTTNDRTWSFWHDSNNEFIHLAKKTWRKGWFYTLDGKQISLDLESYSYSTIEGIDFYNFMNDHVRQFENVIRITEDIIRVSKEGLVQTSQGVYSGNRVFSSFFDKADFPKQKSNYFLWQHFYGFVLKTPENVFDPTRFTLMDYRFSDKKRTNFFYILPFSDKEALIEFTEFSAQLYTEQEYYSKLKDYVENHLNIRNYSIEKVEFNAIPMTDFQRSTIVSNRVFNIGSMAGYVKPSSGYAFTRTISRNVKLAELILSNARITEKELNSTKTYKAFDNAVLYLMKTEKVHGGLIFASLFDRLNADFVFRFLDEKANTWELLRIMMSSPKKIEFIKYFMRKKGK
jgi:lycopene beta-cyclase